jgi:hypothetical protein
MRDVRMLSPQHAERSQFVALERMVRLHPVLKPGDEEPAIEINLRPLKAAEF